MIDLDQAELKRRTKEGPFGLVAGRICVPVPVDLLERITRDFDENVICDPREARFGG